MSTLRCTNLQDTSGSNSLTTAQIYNGAAKAWVNFNGKNTVAIRAQFNVSSITDNGTGNYTVNFTTAMVDANYSAVVSGTETVGSSILGNAGTGRYGANTTSAARVYTFGSQFVPVDAELVHVAIFR